MPAVGHDGLARGVEVVDPQRHVGETGLQHRAHPRVERLGIREAEELQHEAVATQVHRPQADRVAEPEELRRLGAAHVEVEDLLEVEGAGVERPGPVEVPHALTDVTEAHHEPQATGRRAGPCDDEPVQLHDVVAEAARRVPDRTALVTEAGSQTFGELDERVRSLATGLAACTDAGDRVAILAGNRAEYVECYYGVPGGGRVLVPLNQRLHPDEWSASIRRSGARALIAESELLAAVGATAVRRAGIETVVGLDGGAGIDTTYAELVGTGPAGGPGTGDQGSADDTAWLVGTSGTTGSPKLAALTHASLLAAVEATLGARPVGDDDTLLTPFPLCHVAGYNVLVLHRRARPLVLMRRFDPGHLAALVREHGVTMLSLAPTMLSMLLDAADVDDADLTTVRALGYGASPIPAPVLRAAVARWDWDLSQGYGMTELSGNAVFLGPDEHRRAAAGDERVLRAAGRPAPGVEVRIVDDSGEILVRAPQVMAGYWEDPVASGAAVRTAGSTPVTSAGSTTTVCSRSSTA